MYWSPYGDIKHEALSLHHMQLAFGGLLGCEALSIVQMQLVSGKFR